MWSFESGLYIKPTDICWLSSELLERWAVPSHSFLFFTFPTSILASHNARKSLLSWIQLWSKHLQKWVEAVYLVLSTFTSDPNLAGLSKESRTAMANVSFHMKEKIKQYGPSSLGTSLFPAAQVCFKDGTDLWIRWMVRTLGLLNIRDSGGSQDGLLGPDTRERPWHQRWDSPSTVINL